MKQFEIVSAAMQVGTKRSTPQPCDAIGEWSPSASEHRLLVEAGALGLMRRAGSIPKQGVAPVPPPLVETRTTCHRAGEPIRDADAAGFTDAILDWAAKATAHGMVAPIAAIPILIKLLHRDRDVILAVLGERGRWLAELMGKIESSDAPLTTEEARRILAEEFDTLDWKEKGSLLQMLEPSVTMEDEPLLAKVIQDRRKEVRVVAARLLAKLPDSAFARELKHLATGRLRIGRKLLAKTLELDPPLRADLPKGLPSVDSRATLGDQSKVVLDLFSFVPPSHWNRETGMAPTDLIKLSAGTDFDEAVLFGWLNAALLFDDQSWIDALAAAWGVDDRMKWHIEILERASDSFFEERILTMKSVSHGELYYAFGPGRQLTQKASAHLIKLMRTERLQVDPKLAISLHLSVLPMLDDPWQEELDSARRQLKWLLDIRLRLHQSLES